MMQTLYYTTHNFVRRSGNVIDLCEYRSRMQDVQEEPVSAAPAARTERTRRRHPHQNAFALLTEVKLRLSLRHGRNFAPVIADAHALTAFRQRPDARAQQRRLSRARRAENQARIGEIRKQPRAVHAHIACKTDAKRAERLIASQLTVFDHGASAHADAVPARKRHKALPQALRTGICRLLRRALQNLRKLLLPHQPRKPPLGTVFYHCRRLPRAQPKLLHIRNMDMRPTYSL